MSLRNLQDFALNRARLLVFVISAVAFAVGNFACTKKVTDKDTTLNVAMVANVKGLDPIQANDLYSATAVAQMYEGLLEYHYLKRPTQVVPALADGMPTISDDGLTYTFKIKKGVRFQDDPCFPGGKGREVTAQDFVYSWKRLADPRLTSEGFWVFDGKIKGLNEWVQAVKMEKAGYDTPIEGLQTPDSNTLVVKLIKPYFQLQYVLTMAFTTVVPKEAVEKYGGEFLNHPVGTGPYKLEKWVRNSAITLVKNPTWRGEMYPSEGEPGDAEKGLLADAGKPLPFADKIVLNELIEDQPRWQNFRKGNLDYVEITPDNFAAAVQNKQVAPDLAAKGMALDITPNFDVLYIGINMRDPILGKNKLLRQAMAMAQDLPGWSEKFYNGRAMIAQSPIPPGVAGYDPNYKNPYQLSNVERAKELLAKAGYPEGKGLPEFTYETQSDSKRRQQGEFFAQNMAAIGIKVKISASNWPQFQEKIKSGKAQMWAIAWGADYPDAQNFMQLFYGKNVSPGPNDSYFQNAEFDRLYEQSLTMAPGPERDAVYAKLRDIVVEEQPWLLSGHRMRYSLLHGWLRNYKWNDVQNDNLKYLRVDASKRAELKGKL